MQRHLRFAVVGTMLAGALIAAPRAIRANGAEFFEAENDGKVVLYYSGSVKDSQGNPLDKLMVTVSAKNAGLTFPMRNDAPGHFRTIDVGRAIQGAGKTIDPAQIEITITKQGYKMVKVPKIPNKLGAVVLDGFVLDPVAGK
jgi:hypothetical protein